MEMENAQQKPQAHNQIWAPEGQDSKTGQASEVKLVFRIFLFQIFYQFVRINVFAKHYLACLYNLYTLSLYNKRTHLQNLGL